MSFDLTFFGYGVGLMLVGWVAGLVVSVAFSLVRAVHAI